MILLKDHRIHSVHGSYGPGTWFDHRGEEIVKSHKLIHNECYHGWYRHVRTLCFPEQTSSDIKVPCSVWSDWMYTPWSIICRTISTTFFLLLLNVRCDRSSAKETTVSWSVTKSGSNHHVYYLFDMCCSPLLTWDSSLRLFVPVSPTSLCTINSGLTSYSDQRPMSRLVIEFQREFIIPQQTLDWAPTILFCFQCDTPKLKSFQHCINNLPKIKVVGPRSDILVSLLHVPIITCRLP